MKRDYKKGDRVEIVGIPEFVSANKIGQKATVIKDDKQDGLPLLIQIDFTGRRYFFDYEHVKPIQ